MIFEKNAEHEEAEKPSRRSLWLKPRTRPPVTSEQCNQKKMRKTGPDSDSISSSQREGSRSGFAAAMNFASPSWAKIRGAVRTMVAAGTMQEKYTQEFVDNKYSMERRELTKFALAAHLAFVSGWAVLGIHNAKHDTKFFHDVFEMACNSDVSSLQVGLLNVICALICEAYPKVSLIDKTCLLCWNTSNTDSKQPRRKVVIDGTSRHNAMDNNSSENSELDVCDIGARDHFEILVHRLKQKFEDFDDMEKNEKTEDIDEVSRQSALAFFFLCIINLVFVKGTVGRSSGICFTS